MLTLIVRRARVQRGMLAAVVALIAAAACLVGVCTLLLSVSQERAFHAEIRRAQPDDVDVTAFLVNLPGSELRQARERARQTVTDVVAPMRPTLSASAFAPMRRLAGNRLAYLATDDELDERAVLTAGRWPAPTASQRPEAVVPEVAARGLGLHLGDSVTLGEELDTDATHPVDPVTVVVVGTFAPRPGPGWQTDPLSGQGYLPAWAHGSTSPPAYGPFVIGDAAFLATGSTVAGLRVTAHPTLSLAQRSTLNRSADDLGSASALLTDSLRGKVEITRVASQLPQTLARIEAQQASTRSLVLVVMLLGVALCVAAALLAGWLVASRRDDERALLVAFGLSPHQQLTAASLEAGLLGGTAAVIALPAAALTHALLSRLPTLRAAGLTQRPSITLLLVASVVATSLLLAGTLVITALDTGTATDRSARHRVAIRGGFDALLVLVAVVCWWQLRTRPESVSGDDVVLIAAPVLFLSAVTLLLTRLVPVALGVAARLGERSRGLVVPLAAQQAARRPHTATAMVAIATAVAAVTFALGLHATWERSQRDQAELRTGTDVSLVPAAGAGHQASAAIESADERGLLGADLLPVISRPLTLGSYVATGGPAPVVVGVDAARAGTLLRGRLDHGTWAQVGERLAPPDVVRGLALPARGAGVQVRATAPARAGLQAAPTVVLQDRAGIRSSVSADPVPMDGRTHPVSWLTVIGPGQRLVGVRWQLAGPGLPILSAPVSASLIIPATTAITAEESWHVRPVAVGDAGLLIDPDVSVESTGADTVVRASASAALSYFGFARPTLLVTAIPDPPGVPVAVSQDLVDAVGARIGTTLDGIVHGTAVRLRIVAVVPNVPSAPGQVAVLADVDMLTRALVDAGDLDPGVDRWWMAGASPATVRALRHLDLGEITTRSETATRLADGPLRVAGPTALLTLVGAAALLLLMSVGLLLASDRLRRSAEVSRLRALGMASRDARRLLVAENAAFLLPLVVLGALAGAATSAAVSPALIRSDLGASPVPAAVRVWPWGTGTLIVVGLALGALVIAVVLSSAHVRRAEPARVRTEET